jgi:hypothetical protein
MRATQVIEIAAGDGLAIHLLEQSSFNWVARIRGP